MLRTVFVQLAGWPARRWLVALGAATATFLVVAIPTDLIDTPLFTREVPPTWWSVPVLALSAALTGLLVATYVRSPLAGQPTKPNRAGFIGAVVTFFAVGCPVCNKLVLLALGSAGAMQFFEPVQPFLAALSLGLLLWALLRRISQENACSLPVAAPVESAEAVAAQLPR